jgi:hypothetical protein
MARKKNLAGLAALAGLAYMMTRDKAAKAGEAAATSTAPEAAPVAAPVSTEDAAGDFIEAGSGPRGDFMNEVEPGGKSLTASPPKPAATRSIGARAPARTSATARPTAADSDFNMNYSNEGRDRRRARPTVPGSELKKGGSVKGWGMARGARKAKTY